MKYTSQNKYKQMSLDLFSSSFDDLDWKKSLKLSLCNHPKCAYEVTAQVL